MKKKAILFSVGMFITVLSSLYSILEIDKINKELKNINLAVNLAKDIKYYDEVLTMSARMATLNYNTTKWIERYYNNITPLDDAIKKSIYLTPQLKSELEKVDEANKKLIQMEEKSIKYAKQKLFKKAQELLFSEKYNNLKEIYNDGLTNAINLIYTVNENQKKQMKKHLMLTKVSVVFSSIVAITLLIFLYLIVSRTMKREIELDQLNQKLEEEIADKIKKLRQSDLTNLEQAKMASMGEMIGNIAHQWRQPLSVISTGATGLKFQKEFNLLTDKTFIETCDTINTNAQYLSKTIETFKDFIKSDKKIKEVAIEDEILQGIHIVETTLKNRFIKLKDNINYEDKSILLITEGELPQVVINILNNAKDIILQKDIKNAWIELNLIKEKDYLIFSIEDNGGGVPDNILPHIFEPYFTTKHKSQGTGLGLHMSYRIITESLKGNIWVENTKNGAKFYIKIPLK